MTDYISEQEILKLLQKLDLDLQNVENEHATTGINHDKTIEDGKIKVEQGKIIIANPVNGGQFPYISAQPPLKIIVDGKEIVQAAQVSSESEIEWKVDEKPLFEITVSENNLEAYLCIHRKQRHPWTITEQAPSVNVTVTAAEDPSIILEEINLQDVLASIENMNIKMNLDIGLLQSEILKPTHQPIVIARGKAPVQGEDALLKIFFSENIENVFSEVGGIVDFKNHMRIPSVKNGDVIAQKIPPSEGQPGYDVFGNMLLPEPVNDIRIAGKESVEVTPDFTVIARKEGRPRITGNKIKYFDINTAYIVPGNVDLQTGNIVFAGDVIVYGDVMDNMIIESLGNIYVSGSVYNSTLTATGSIAVKGNVLGGKLYSGYFGMLYNRLYNGSKQLTEYLNKMMQSIKLLTDEMNKKKMQIKFGQALLLITENKYRQAWDIAKELSGVITALQSYNKDTLQSLLNYLELFLSPIKMVEVMTAPRMEDFMRVLREAYMRVALSQESQVQINFNQAQNSTLKSNGDILIRRDGVIQCDLYSAGNIIFFLDEAVCRGSKLEAGDTISAMYVGGITGVGTTLKAKKKVIVKKMYEGRVMIDHYTKDILEPIEEMTFDIDNIRQKRSGGN